MPSLDMLRKLLDEFAEKEAHTREEITVISQRIEELEKRVGAAKQKLITVARDREKVLTMQGHWSQGTVSEPTLAGEFSRTRSQETGLQSELQRPGRAERNSPSSSHLDLPAQTSHQQPQHSSTAASPSVPSSVRAEQFSSLSTSQGNSPSRATNQPESLPSSNPASSNPASSNPTFAERVLSQSNSQANQAIPQASSTPPPASATVSSPANSSTRTTGTRMKSLTQAPSVEESRETAPGFSSPFLVNEQTLPPASNSNPFSANIYQAPTTHSEPTPSAPSDLFTAPIDEPFYQSSTQSSGHEPYQASQQNQSSQPQSGYSTSPSVESNRSTNDQNIGGSFFSLSEPSPPQFSGVNESNYMSQRAHELSEASSNPFFRQPVQRAEPAAEQVPGADFAYAQQQLKQDQAHQQPTTYQTVSEQYQHPSQQHYQSQPQPQPQPQNDYFQEQMQQTHPSQMVQPQMQPMMPPQNQPQPFPSQSSLPHAGQPQQADQAGAQAGNESQLGDFEEEESDDTVKSINDALRGLFR